MIVYGENSKQSTEKLLELLSNFGKLAKYKVDIQKLIAFLHTSNEQVEFEIRNTLSLTLTPKKTKYLGVNLTNYVQDLRKNYKLMKEMKELTK